MIDKLVARMETEIVEFCFLKGNGEVRTARGTLRQDICPKIMGGGRPTPEHLQVFYDVDKQAWRSFNKERLIAIQ